MSLSIFDGKIGANIKLDKRIQASKHYNYSIEKSGTDLSYIPYAADTASTSSLLFTINAMSEQMFLDRKLIMNVAFDFTLVGTPHGGSGLLFPNGSLGGVCALRWCPLQSCTTDVSLQVNSSKITFSPSYYLEPLDRYSGDPFVNNELSSIYPSAHDVAQQYADSYQTNISPLGGYFDSNTPTPRGAFSYQVISDNGTTAVLRFVWSEPLIMSPLLYSKFESKGFYGLTSDLSIQMNFGDLRRMLSIDQTNGPVITSITPAFYGTPTIVGRWITPPAPIPISEPQFYPYTQFVYAPLAAATLASGSSTSVTSNTLSLLAVPSKVLIFLRQSAASRLWNNTDTYARIDQVNINFNNKSGILSSCTSRDLFLIAQQNGLKNLPWTAWNQHVGSPLLLEFGRDIPMSQDIACDMLGRYNFYATINYTNVSTSVTDIAYELCMVFFYNGIMTIQNGSSRLDIGLVQPSSLRGISLLEAEVNPPADFMDEAAFYNGGSFIDKAKKLGSNVVNIIKKGADFVNDTGVPLVEKALPYIKKYGPSVAKAAAMVLPLLAAGGIEPDDENMSQILRDAGFSDMDLRAAGLSGGSSSGSGLSGGSFRKGGAQIRDPAALLRGRYRS